MFKTQIKGIIDGFYKKQKEILLSEHIMVDNLKSKFLLELSKFDSEAKALHSQEAIETNNFLSSFANSNSKIEEILKQAYKDILGMKFEKHEFEKSGLQKNLNILQSQEEAEINSLINSPNKLSKYTISNATIFNIGDNSKSALYATGIRTAADFTDISGDGCFKNRSGVWVKAYGIGWSRAYDLQAWQKGLEAKENQIITKSIKQIYQSRFIAINNTIKNCENIFDKDIYPFKLQYNREKALFEENKLKLFKSHTEKLAEIKSKYNLLHIPLNAKANQYAATMPFQLTYVSEKVKKRIDTQFRK